MRVDHVTYHVPAGTLDGDGLSTFMMALGFREIPARDPFEHGWKVRWFTRATARLSEINIHFVETDDGEQDSLALGHFCVCVGHARLEALAQSDYCVRNSGSGRIWLQYANVRVEVRP